MAIRKVETSLTQLAGCAALGMTSRPRVFVLSDIRLLREGVVLALARQPSVRLIGSSDLSTPPCQIAGLAPDALLLDITVPGGLDISSLIRYAMPNIRIVALGVAEIEQVVMECAKAGVSAFVARNGSVQDVVEAVHSAIRGELICSPRTAGILLSHVTALVARPPAGVDDSLTLRESEIARLVGDGLSNKQIARSLGIQSATVKNHVHNILSKLRMRRRVEVALQSRRRPIDDMKSSDIPTPRPNGSAGHNGTGPDPTI
jgi:two-component system, NarL family, nitrate/nitrite response regulator NarL